MVRWIFVDAAASQGMAMVTVTTGLPQMKPKAKVASEGCLFPKNLANSQVSSGPKNRAGFCVNLGDFLERMKNLPMLYQEISYAI